MTGWSSPHMPPVAGPALDCPVLQKKLLPSLGAAKVLQSGDVSQKRPLRIRRTGLRWTRRGHEQRYIAEVGELQVDNYHDDGARDR